MSVQISPLIKKIIFILAIICCFTPFIDPPLALLIGFIIAQTIGHPFLQFNHKTTSWLLKTSVVGLGFGINIHHAIEAGKSGLVFTFFLIALTFLFGWLLSKWLKVESKTSFLISSGTAICGGSAIAAVSPIVKADAKQMSVALGTIFILNSVALLIFPTIGHWLNLSQQQFGLWCAIAIHDTSSVVGASAKYGQEALQIATTIKLERALWIIPLSIVTVLFTKTETKKISIPYFIGFYILAMCLGTYFPEYTSQYSNIVLIAKKGLTITLFLIGAGLSMDSIKTVGIKPLLQGVILWVLISVLSVLIIYHRFN
jgi:uncharacterized integral membrane protein (TIGR00698 family)